jgi:putative zinc finger protein
MGCERTHELAAELALGILDGEQRAQALRHLAECPECRRAVEELTAVADELLMLAPEREPPAGFESRVLARLQPPPAATRPTRRLRRMLAPVAAAAAAAAIAVAVVVQATGDDRRLADDYRAALAAGHGSSFEAARLRAPGEVPAGVVYAYRGRTSWIFVVVYRAHRAVPYRAELATTSGRRVALPSFRLDPKNGTGGEAIPVDLSAVSSVRLVGPRPGDVLEADLSQR